jgi:UDPglucose 6-dehydrogenase
LKISIIGSGYVGLVTGSCLAEIGHSVTCLDINKKRVANLKKGILPIYEPQLENLVAKNIKNKNLNFTDTYASITEHAIFFICVDTPNNNQNKPNLKNLFSVISSLGDIIKEDAIVVLKSTVPLGTNQEVYKRLIKKIDNKKLKITVVSNPEFLREGSAVNDFMKPERIIIGTDSFKARKILQSIYKPLCRKSDKIIFMSTNSAELTKYSANAFLATKISFVNEIAAIAELVGADMHEVRKGIGSDSRIGKDFLYAGLGYGGSCFPKDLKALSYFQKVNGLHSSIISATQERNNHNVSSFVEKINFSFKEPKTSSLLIWGSSFKPDTDDIRESLAIKVINSLSDKFKNIYVYDPEAAKNTKEFFHDVNNVVFIKNKYNQISNCSGLVICTEWKEFWNPDYKKLSLLKERIILDGRNILNRKDVEKNNLIYKGIGT